MRIVFVYHSFFFQYKTDPVVLPSKNVMDRSIITRHLLSDPKDPFTKQPLKVEDLEADLELKAKIEEWRKNRK